MTLDRETRLLALTFAEQLTEIQEGFVDRGQVVRLLAIGALCQEHVLVIGPPGTAKTLLVQRFCQLLDTKPFTYLLSRFTEPSELFGPINVQVFQDHARYEINTEGMLPSARVAFLDEVFQGSSAILNTLLTLLNERVFYDGRPGSDGRTPLLTLIGSSNDVPTDPVLAAFSDRFLLRCRLSYVSPAQIEDVLLLGWQDEQQRIRAATGRGNGAARTVTTIAEADLRTLQQTVAEIDLSAVYEPYLRILRAAKAAGIVLSDRRKVKAQKVFAAAALLDGRAAAEPKDLTWLTHVWTDPRDDESLRRIVAGHGIPVIEPTSRVRPVHQITEVELATLVVRRGQVSREQEFDELITTMHRLVGELRRDHPDEAAALSQAQKELGTTIALKRERFPWMD